MSFASPASPGGPVDAVSPPVESVLLDKLNPEQRAAVTLPNEHALILAGAGSGKTRVLTTRIAWLLQNGLVSPGGVLAVTFTNKAAREMATRLQAMLPVNVRGMWIGTFHGLCNRLLRAHFKAVNLPQTFQILDTQDQLSAIKRLYKLHNIDDERYPPKQVQWFIAGCKEDGVRPAQVEAHDSETRKRAEIYQLYEDQCQKEGVVDFGELMLRSYELLRDHPAVRAHYQRRFRHILIDEFQDTNKLQYAWIKMLAGVGVSEVSGGFGSPVPAGSVMAVGDDDQSIYAFRGARVGNMADFVREFAVQHQIKLEQNYRSFSNILDSANALISQNQRRLGKNLRTDQGAGEPVRVQESVSDFAEAQWLVDEVKQLHREGVPLVEQAVLYRSNAQSRVIETALFNAGLPYKVYGGLRFFERAEIKHALAYLRLIENPADDTSFLRVVNFPPRGIGARTVEMLQDAAQAAGASLHAAAATLKGSAATKVHAFIAILDVLREQTVSLSLRETVELVLAHSGLVEHYRADREGEDRIENLEELVNAAESFVTQEGFGKDAVALPVDELAEGQSVAIEEIAARGHPASPNAFFDLENSTSSESLTERAVAAQTAADLPTGETLSPLAAFLSHAALESGDTQAGAGQDAVQLMTVHSSKGLEFDVVFIGGLEEGLFPHENSLSSQDGLEEERRLMYVAITRARRRLYLSHSQTRLLHGQTRYNVQSRFLDELPEHALKWLAPKSVRHQFVGSSAAHGAAGRFGDHPGALFSGAARGRQSWQEGHFSSGFSEPATGLGKALQPQAGVAGFRAGDKVFHNKFGEGKVLQVEGSGADARAQINFPRHGVKWLALSIAKLTALP
jgi:DNA helicase II / ATP-dependent DNA helicase PcrA